MPLGMTVGLSPGDPLLDGDSAPLATKGWIPLHNFRPISRDQTAGCIKMPLNWYGGRPQPRGFCVRWRPSTFHKKL